MRTLTPDQALACANRSHFLSSPGSSVGDVAGQIVGLHNTSQVSPYLSMRARMDDFERADLDEVMWGTWELARFRAMRLTMFILPVDLLEVAAAATQHISEPYTARWLRDSGLTPEEFQRLSEAVLETLIDGPLTSRQLRKALAVPQEVILPSIVSRLCEQGHVAGGAPPGSWRSNIRQFHLWADVLPGVDITRWDEDAAITELIRRYVYGYGPVTVSDMAWWTGFGKTRCRRALEGLGGEIEEVSVDGWPGPLFLRQDATISDDGSGVKALPLLDPYVQGYRDRVRLLDDARHAYVYDGGGNSSATLVYRGRIIGVWQTVRKPPAIRFHLFEPRAKGLLRQTEQALEAAATIYFDRPVDLVEVEEMEPLTGSAGARSAAHPLDEVLHRAGRRDQR